MTDESIAARIERLRAPQRRRRSRGCQHARREHRRALPPAADMPVIAIAEIFGISGPLDPRDAD